MVILQNTTKFGFFFFFFLILNYNQHMYISIYTTSPCKKKKNSYLKGQRNELIIRAKIQKALV